MAWSSFIHRGWGAFAALLLAGCSPDVPSQAVCAAGTAVCGESCVNLQRDPEHCGGCGYACADGQQCAQGACVDNCAAGTEWCGNSCVNVATDPLNCGACANACPDGGLCSAGECVSECPAGTEACDGGCVDIMTDPLHCGGCDEMCAAAPGASAACESGACALECNSGYADCNGAPNDGCESATQTDAENCGGCGNVCNLDHAQTECTAGACAVGSCNADFDDCNGSPTDGCEVDLTSDPSHCSSCGMACGASEICEVSACVSSCTSGVIDGTETDVDCGGGACPGCAFGMLCTQGGDCASGKCANGHCAALTLAFAPAVSYQAGFWTTAVALGDYDYDGDLDAASVDYAGSLYVRLNFGTGTLGSQSAYTVPWGSFGLVAAELNGDSYLDLAVTSVDSNYLTILSGAGNGSFIVGTPIPIPGGPSGLAAGDIDGDSDIDLAVACYMGGGIRILLNNGAGQFTQTSYQLAGAPRGIALADFNVDGRPDVVIADSSMSFVIVALQNTSGAFIAASQTSVGGYAAAVATGDLDGDGHPDAVVSAETQQFALLGNGQGGLSIAHQASASTTWGSTLADFDLDGVLDAATMQLNANEVVVWRGNGSGSFLGPNAFPAGTTQMGGAAGDMNGDGKLDLVVAGGSYVAVMLNAGQ